MSPRWWRRRRRRAEVGELRELTRTALAIARAWEADDIAGVDAVLDGLTADELRGVLLVLTGFAVALLQERASDLGVTTDRMYDRMARWNEEEDPR